MLHENQSMNSLYLRPRVCFWSHTLLFGLIRIWDVVRNGADLGSVQRKPQCLIRNFDTLIGEDMIYTHKFMRKTVGVHLKICLNLQVSICTINEEERKTKFTVLILNKVKSCKKKQTLKVLSVLLNMLADVLHSLHRKR